jgi:hypothetical protein
LGIIFTQILTPFFYLDQNTAITITLRTFPD